MTDNLQVKYFITAILPLKLEWEPWYYTDRPLERGTRIRVKLAGKEYIAVVDGIFGHPGIDEGKIRSIEKVEEGLARITSEELKLWHFISEYYMCTLGEVYKTAYPAVKTVVEARKPRKKNTEDKEDNLITERLVFNDERPVLLVAPNRSSTYKDLIEKKLKEGKDILYLSPSAPALSYTQIRDISSSVRSTVSEPRVIFGRKSALFLPYAKLGLIIVDEEADISYKQNSPAPRYNGRDVAVMLAGIHGADIVLGSSSPSLESIYNVNSGKYRLIEYQGNKCPVDLIDTTREARKNGMEGDLSKKLLAIKEQVEVGKKKMLIVESWELGKALRLKLDKYAAVAVLHFEFLLSRQDFRADEKALRLIERLRSEARRLVIQTKDASHPVFSGRADLMAERKEFNLPPFRRQINIIIKDFNRERLDKLSGELSNIIAGNGFSGSVSERADNTFSFSIFLAKDKSLGPDKKKIARIISDFETSRKYSGHITINVDPL